MASAPQPVEDHPDGTGAPETPGVVIGNYHQKYTSTNPLIRWLTRRWVGQLDELFAQVAATCPDARVLEVGCGEGAITDRLTGHWRDVTALDLPDATLRAAWSEVDGVRFLHADAEQLPFAADQFDVLVSVEVLEHLVHPAVGLAEYARVGRGHLIVSVPREPIFRLGNLAAGRYVRRLGNSPGHFNHWSTRRFVQFLERVGTVQRVATPLPWTVVWLTLD